MRMPPKPKTKCRRKGGSVSDDLFHYNNQVELTFKNQAKSKALGTLKDANSSSSEDEEEPVSKRKVETVETNTNHSSSSENEYDLIGSDSDKEKPDRKKHVVDRPITPPPDVPLEISNYRSQGLKLTRDVDSKLKSLHEVTQQDQSPYSVTGWSDVVIVDQNTPSPCERKITVRIRTSHGVERFPIRMSDQFDGIIRELASKQGVPVETILLSFADKEGNQLTLKGSDTPSSVNLSYANIIDCIIVSSAPRELLEDEENVVNIKIQGSQANTVKLFKAFKNEELGSVMQQYADFRELPLAKIKFLFDGEVITANQTPDDLEMDEDNVIDVRLS